MDKQSNVERCSVLLASLLWLEAFPGFHRWAFACSHNPSNGLLAQAVRPPYEPQFFSAEQFRMVDHLAEMIIPANDTPGAKQAGVAEFIDFMVANKVRVTDRDAYQSLGRGRIDPRDNIRIGDEVQEQFVLGLAWLNSRSKSECGHEFMDCFCGSAERSPPRACV